MFSLASSIHLGDDESCCTKDSVSDHLRSSGICDRCILKFLGMKEVKLYEGIKSKEAEVCESPEEKGKPKPCVSCLGLLQDHNIKSNITKIVAAVNAGGYDAESFTTSLSLPTVLLLRTHCILTHLRKHYPSVYAKVEHEELLSMKDIWKTLVHPPVSEQIHKQADSHGGGDFLVCVTQQYHEDQTECAKLLFLPLRGPDPPKKKRHRPAVTRMQVEREVSNSSEDDFLKLFPFPPPVIQKECDYVVHCEHNPVFVAGRYLKFSRSLSQTPWMVDGERKLDSSVQELISDKLLGYFKASDAKFSASGREDIDVRTLGRGRPFVLELFQPHRIHFFQDSMTDMQEDINRGTKDIAVLDLQIVSRADTSNLKEGEEEKTKTYTALCRTLDSSVDEEKLKELESLKNVVLEQETPVRVLHRRPLAVRQKIVHQLKASKVSDTLFTLSLKTQAGTYIKEFIHGDLGRTKPSLGTLMGGASVDILALDVEAVDLDWPPPLNATSKCDSTVL